MASELGRPIDFVPGFTLLLGVALISRYATAVLVSVDTLLVAVAIGAVITNLLDVPDTLAAGLSLHKLLLEIGIVLMGVQLSLEHLRSTGALVIVLASLAVFVGILYVELLAQSLFDIDNKMRSLIAAGAGVCGVSAVVAVAGSIGADEDEIAYAASIIILFDAITLITYPVVGNLLHLPPKQFGIWAGLSMFSTGPVAAVGFAHSDIAGQWATLTKLARNSFIGLVALMYSMYYIRKQFSVQSNRTSVRHLWDKFPKFLIGFLFVVIVANLGYLAPSEIASIKRLTDWCFVLAFSGLGFEIKVGKMARSEAEPILTMLVYLLTFGAATLGIVVLVVS